MVSVTVLLFVSGSFELFTSAVFTTDGFADSAITFDHATLNDAVRMVGEPDIFDHAGGAYVSGPGGSTTQASWFWKSDDGGVQWRGCQPVARSAK